ncbi:MAG: class I SAM-dependent methyltransferase [Gammaproteobacteria bacterium]
MLKRPLRRLVDGFARRLFDHWCDPVQAMRLIALDKTVEFLRTHGGDALCLRTREKLLDFAVGRMPQEGLIAEFGVDRGASIRHIAARVAPRTVFGFDGFAGNPEDWSGWNAPRGVFDRGGALPRVPGNVQLVKGWFQDTLPDFVRVHPEPVALLHVDCDLYSSTKTIFQWLADRLRPGSVIVFDEYFNYVNWEQHEHKAFQEMIASTGLRYRYAAYSTRQMMVIVQ